MAESVSQSGLSASIWQPTSLVLGYTVRLPNIRLRTNEADDVTPTRTNSLNTAHVRFNDQSLAEKRSRASSAHWISSMKLMSDMSHFIISVRRSFCRSRTSGRRESKSQDDGGAAKQDLGDIRVAPLQTPDAHKIRGRGHGLWDCCCQVTPV